jgi:dimeric dUTPase (all-alpha-NTP-PPase superfamily)
MSENKFQEMWEQQHEFMELLREKRNFPTFPVDLTSKSGQKFLRSVTYECMGELFEANQELKNSKGHRATDVREIDKEAYLEELCDSMHYFLEIVIASGFTLEEFVEAYLAKGRINHKRICDGY